MLHLEINKYSLSMRMTRWNVVTYHQWKVLTNFSRENNWLSHKWNLNSWVPLLHKTVCEFFFFYTAPCLDSKMKVEMLLIKIFFYLYNVSNSKRLNTIGIGEFQVFKKHFYKNFQCLKYQNHSKSLETINILE